MDASPDRSREEGRDTAPAADDLAPPADDLPPPADDLPPSEARYRALFQASPEAYLVVGTDGRIVEANAAAGRTFGLEPAELVGRLAAEFAIVDDGDPVAAESELGAGRPVVRRGLATRSDGSAFPYESIGMTGILDGEPRLFTIIRDQTESERFQQELVQAQKMEAVGLLVAGVAHELNNPLAAIVAFSDLIRRDPRLPEDMQADADMLIAEAGRTRRIVSNLLDFARQRPPERHPTSIRALVSSVVELQSYSIKDGRVRVSVDLPDDLPAVEVDRSQLQQVLVNLTLNAVQSMRAAHGGGHLRITARVVDGGESRLRLVVEDDGPGVPEVDRAHLFVPFFTTKPPGQGTGLGLPVSFGIVAAHGGRLWYEPVEAGTGARFVMELPLRAATVPLSPVLPDAREAALAAGVDPDEVAEPAEPLAPIAPVEPALPIADTPGASSLVTPAATPATGAAPSDEAAPRVLVLDDEPAIRAFLVKALRSQGLVPVAASTGAEALELAREGDFALMLCDHRMAGMTGTAVYEALERVRPELARRFVFMSGDVLNPELRAFAVDRGVMLLAKPFDLATIATVVRDVLDRVD